MYELIWNQTEFRSVSNQNWNFQYEQIPFNSKENENLLGWVYNAGKQVFMRRGWTGIVKVTRKPQADWERRKKNKNKNDYIHTQKNIFEILLNQTEIRLYFPFTIDLEPDGRPFGSKSIGNGKYNTISVWLNKISNRFLYV